MDGGITRGEPVGEPTQSLLLLQDRDQDFTRCTWRQYTPQRVPRTSEVASGMIMVDPGSDTNFIRHDFALSLGITGEPCQF